MDFQEFIQNKANELVSLDWPDDMILCFIDGAERVQNYFGWHTGSELPKEDGEYITIMSNSLGEHGEVCYNDFSNGEWSYTGYDWEPRKVLLWIRKPKKD